MKTTMDRFGRIVVPKELRDRHGLQPGSEVEIEDAGGSIVLRPLAEMPGLVEKEGILVFRARATGDVEDGLRAHRAQRANKVGGQGS